MDRPIKNKSEFIGSVLLVCPLTARSSPHNRSYQPDLHLISPPLRDLRDPRVTPHPLPSPEDIAPLNGLVAESLANDHYEIPFSKERLELLLRYIGALYPLRTACALCGLDESSFDRWCHFAPEVRRVIDVAVEAARVPALDSLIARARAGDSAAWTAWLRLSSAGQFGPCGTKTINTQRSKHLLEGGTMVFDGELPKLREGYRQFLDDSHTARLAARQASAVADHGSSTPAAPVIAQAPTAPREVEPSPTQEVAPPFVRPNPPASSSARPAAGPVLHFAKFATALVIGASFLFAILVGAAKASFLNDGSHPAPSFSTTLAGRFDRDAAPLSLRPHLPDPVFPVPILH